MSGISTHVVNTATGQPAANVRVRLFDGHAEIASALTNADGRCPALLPPDVPLRLGTYRMVFEVASSFAEGFYPEVSISFHVKDASAHHHVPLLISGFGFTTYRGS